MPGVSAAERAAPRGASAQTPNAPVTARQRFGTPFANPARCTMAPMRDAQPRFGYADLVALPEDGRRGDTVRSVLLPGLAFRAGRLFPFA